MSNSHQTNLLDTPGQAQNKLRERVFAWVANDPVLSENTKKCSLTDQQQSLDMSQGNHNFGFDQGFHFDFVKSKTTVS